MSSAIVMERVWTDKSTYNDAEKKYYELHSIGKKEIEISENCDVTQTINKRSKNKKLKKESVANDEPIEVEPEPVVNDIVVSKKKAKSSSNSLPKEEEVSLKPDTGTAEEAKPKKSKSKKQKEKKAAAAAAAVIAAAGVAVSTTTAPHETASEMLTKSINKESQSKEKILIDITTKPKEKKKKSKKDSSVSMGQKAKDDKNGINSTTSCPLASEIAKAREHIKSSLQRVDGANSMATPGVEFLDRISALEKDNQQLRGVVEKLQKLVIDVEGRLNSMINTGESAKQTPSAAVVDDDDVDLFGSEDEDNEEAEKLKAERVAAYAAKKSAKPALIAKSSVILDIKPWDDETDMKEMEKHVRSIVMDGLLWGASKLVPVGYGINKLQICCVIVDDKVSVDDLQDKLAEFEDFVQSSDIAAFQKI